MIHLQLFGGGGGSSGGNYKMTGHKLPEKGKPNSTMTRYDNKGIKRDKRYYDSNGDKKQDTHYTGAPNHDYPHDHYWYKDENGNWQRTTYEDWKNGGKK